MPSAFLPWAIGGPLLAVVADRFPVRRVVVSCDVARALLIGAAAIPGMPLPAIGALVLASAFLASPFESASSAVLPLVLTDDERYSVATSIRSMTNQCVSLAGFALGGLVVAVVTARGALAFDALTFAVSAVLLRRGLQDRPAAMAGRARTARPSLVSDTLEGLRVVAADPRRYGPLLVAVVGVGFMIVPEAIATALAHSRGYGPVAVGLIMGAYAAGSVIGGFVLVQLTSAETRRRWMWRMALLGAAADGRGRPAPGAGGAARPARPGRGLRVVPARRSHGVRGRGARRGQGPGVRHRVHRDVHRAGRGDPARRSGGPAAVARHRGGRGRAAWGRPAWSACAGPRTGG